LREIADSDRHGEAVDDCIAGARSPVTGFAPTTRKRNKNTKHFKEEFH
jgi:hypothetical protein